VLSKFKFTNAYRASDRVSQYLIKEVIYNSDLSKTPEETVFEFPNATEDEFYDELARRRAVPLGRAGYAEEAADLAAFLLSERAAYITGAAVNLDGGLAAVL